MQVYSITMCFYLRRMERLFGDDVKNSCPALLLLYDRKGAAS